MARCAICGLKQKRGMRRIDHSACWRTLGEQADQVQDEMGNWHTRRDPVPK